VATAVASALTLLILAYQDALAMAAIVDAGQPIQCELTAVDDAALLVRHIMYVRADCPDGSTTFSDYVPKCGTVVPGDRLTCYTVDPLDCRALARVTLDETAQARATSYMVFIVTLVVLPLCGLFVGGFVVHRDFRRLDPYHAV
jgi:hypothetical protein